MASKYIVRAVTHGTGVNLAASGNTPQRALFNVQRKPQARHAACFVVYSRKTGAIVHTQANGAYRTLAQRGISAASKWGR